MAQFYGTLQGSRGEATRCGTKTSGMEAVAASWNGAVRVYLKHHEDGRETFYVEQIPWHGQGVRKIIAEGEIGS